ncbi:hypothetical protein [Maritimibacter sp. 55A14]|uniref:hypothetical protein n=1 Tax=Maritimibacter sp. 55A14 TaxID=2174844 RepID=UPI0011B27CDF|nr:hypothetical protein [Maritimibacter sp. 55A14]
MVRRITFVVGAGASAEFGLPTGRKLAEQIVKFADIRLDEFGGISKGDKKLFEVCKLLDKSARGDGAEPNPSYEMQRIVSGVPLAPSIDNYLHAHAKNEFRLKFGKALILRSLYQAERDSQLFFDPDNIYREFEFSELGNTWLAALFKILASAGTLETFLSRLESFSFVVFNYDRVIERFFFLALQVYFDLSEDEAAQKCHESLYVIHPYGDLGELQGKRNDSGFGADVSSREIFSKISRIRTFTEGGEKRIKSALVKCIDDSQAIFFLGFSFLKINMDLLHLSHRSDFDGMFGTLRGVSDFNASLAMQRLKSWSSDSELGRVNDFSRCDCWELISNYSGYIAGEDMSF